jgi:hypothetical protein
MDSFSVSSQLDLALEVDYTVLHLGLSPALKQINQPTKKTKPHN